MLEPESKQIIGAVLVDRYRIQSKLGSGGMSTVYLAVDLTLDRPVAIKLLHREISGTDHQLARFRKEAKSAARLSNPNLVPVIDAGEQNGRPFIVFEYVEGQTLKEVILARGPLPVDQAVAYSIEIARGLQAAHENLLVHRDVKPQNVLIDREGRARVTDFGIARSLEDDGVTDTGEVVGTTDYVSPEQASGDLADERSDIYALGIVLYELLTGEVPFQAESQIAVAMKHVSERIPDVAVERPGVPATVAAVVDRATEKDPDSRYESIAEMIADLEISLDESTARAPALRRSDQATTVLKTVPPARRPLTSSGRSSRSGWKVAIGLLGVLIIIGALVWGGGQLGGWGGSSLPVVAIGDFDPEGDGVEHSTEVERIVDGDPSGSAWSSETYSVESFGNKSGMGFWVETEGPQSVDQVDLRLSEPGASVTVYSASGAGTGGPPDSLGDWTPVGEADDLGTKGAITLDSTEPSSYYLIWFTRLPASDEGDGYRVEVSDLNLIG
jgi:serine/threonine-protein kinase